VQQARELVTSQVPAGVIHVSTCDDAKPLLKSSVIVPAQTAVTMIPTWRPLIRSELSLPSIPDFRCPTWRRVSRTAAVQLFLRESRVPSPPVEIDWAKKKKAKKTDVVDMLLSDPGVARFYWALARMDAETLSSLRQSNALKRWFRLPPSWISTALASAFDLARSCTGGPAAAPAWKDLVGANPDAPGEFVPKLLAGITAGSLHISTLSRVSCLLSNLNSLNLPGCAGL